MRSRRRAASGLSHGNVVYLASVGVIAMAMAAGFFGTGYTLLAGHAPGTSSASTPPEPDRHPIVFPTISLAPSPAVGSVPAPERNIPLAPSPPVEVVAEPAATLRARALSSADPTLSAAEISGLLAKGDALLQIGDIASARLFYERAATAGNARAALLLGATFDPAFLERSGLRNLKGDEAAARSWYSRALDLGAVAAKRQLDGLENRQGR